MNFAERKRFYQEHGPTEYSRRFGICYSGACLWASRHGIRCLNRHRSSQVTDPTPDEIAARAAEIRELNYRRLQEA